jgi:acetate CoA/acetoacetate CoA-transferase beta subunit
MGVFEITRGGVVLTELHPDFTVEQIQQATEAKITVSPSLIPMRLE